MIDGRPVFSTLYQIRCFGDIFPFKFTLTRTPLIPHRSEDLHRDANRHRLHDTIPQSLNRTPGTEEQDERKYVSSLKGIGMKTKLKGDDRMYGKNMKKPIKVVSEKVMVK